MCLYLHPKQSRKATLTTRPYYVYKVLKKTPGPFKDSEHFYTSPYYSKYKWTPSQKIRYAAMIRRVTSPGTIYGFKQFPTVSQGFHACRTLKQAKCLRRAARPAVIVRMVIPAGAHLYYGDNYDVVTNQIIFSDTTEY